ncbi:MAG: EscU/YscU/HrcU family type III secretion system export apparatus switch protein [Pseudohongiellaceae bacterium]
MKNKESRAAAIEYGQLKAPQLIARAEGEMAELMKEAAQRSGTPVMTDDALLEALLQLPLNEEIPESLYVAVAVVLSWAYWLTGRRPDSM